MKKQQYDKINKTRRQKYFQLKINLFFLIYFKLNKSITIEKVGKITVYGMNDNRITEHLVS